MKLILIFHSVNDENWKKMRFKIILEAAKGYMEVERQITPRAGAIYTRFTMNHVSVIITFLCDYRG